MAKTEKVKRVKHHAALPYLELPAFMAELRAASGVAARALEFTILMATRAGETRGTTRSELNLAARVWTIPGERMKGGKEHRVPLSGRAVAILSELPRMGEHVFPGAHGGPMHENAMWLVLRKLRPGLTVHGFRSTFRTWAEERTAYPREVWEQALAHTIGSAVERATDLLERRARLMADWATFCTLAPSEGEVVPLRA